MGNKMIFWNYFKALTQQTLTTFKVLWLEGAELYTTGLQYTSLQEVSSLVYLYN